MDRQGDKLILEGAEAQLSGLPPVIELANATNAYTRVAARAVACTEYADALTGDRSCRADSQQLSVARERARVLSSLACQLAQVTGVAAVNQEDATVEAFRRSISEL